MEASFRLQCNSRRIREMFFLKYANYFNEATDIQISESLAGFFHLLSFSHLSDVSEVGNSSGTQREVEETPQSKLTRE
ncbi:hypothetical protein CEXT_213811 [Caerostris extrusa]|uniref:Maturase K n=1 Tax=Caerostris extrusa TaxID=172846 RepID=A0AAV4V5Q1_CAEEX|nr:hypothetical protein CEXT_213811 [Caerostris extrusa]